jgi:hypothetical protein
LKADLCVYVFEEIRNARESLPLFELLTFRVVLTLAEILTAVTAEEGIERLQERFIVSRSIVAFAAYVSCRGLANGATAFWHD